MNILLLSMMCYDYQSILLKRAKIIHVPSMLFNARRRARLSVSVSTVAIPHPVGSRVELRVARVFRDGRFSAAFRLSSRKPVATRQCRENL